MGEDGTGFVHRTDGDGIVLIEGVAPGRHAYRSGGGGSGYLPATATTTVASGQEDASADVALTPDARISGTVPVRAAGTIRVVAQNAVGDVVSAQENDGSGSFTLTGLPAGTFTVVAEDRARHVYDRVAVTTTAGSTTAAPRGLVPATPDPIVSGRIAEGRKAHVALVAGHDGMQLTSTVSDGYAATYRLLVPPGRYTARTTADRRESVESAPLRLTASITRHLRVGRRTTSASAVFLLHGHRVRPSVRATAADGTAIRFDTQGRHGAMVTGFASQGRYAWARTGAALAVDGPWTFAPPRGGFVLGGERTTDLGTVPVTIAD